MLVEPSAPRETNTVRRGFEDGLGRRYRPAARLDSEAPLEILCFRHEITDVPAFDFALRERVARLSDLHDPSFGRIRKVDRLNDERGTVVLMSDGIAGVRLIELLSDVERTGKTLDLNAALHLVRQLLSAVAVLHQKARVAHGAIAPERLFVTPRGKLLVVEYALGAALEQLKYSRERYWKELRVALPMDDGPARFDERADLVQSGVVALSLILGRPLGDHEYPEQIKALVASAAARTADGGKQPLPSALREWLNRTLQLDARNSFSSVVEAEAALGQLLSEHATYNAQPGSVEAFMERLHNPTIAPNALVGAIPTPVEPPQVAEIAPVISSPQDPTPTAETAQTEMSDERAQELDDEEEAMRSAQTGRRKPALKWIVAAAALVAVTTVGVIAARGGFSPAPPPITVGTMTVQTDPAGAEVEIDGTVRGRSPISLSLPPGAHTLVVRGDGESRSVPITITAGAEVSQYLELPKAGAGLGRLQVRTEPAGARVSIDGTPVGKTPMTIIELAPGEHTVTLENEQSSVTQKVMIEAGMPASLVVPMGAPAGALASGWISVTAPVVVDLQENGRLLGNSGIDRIMLPAGRHEIELVNEHVGYRETRTVQVTPGRTAAITVTLPKGSVSLNAIPWASVSIDGENIGDTPIGNYPLAVGQHEVIFRNAELGEQRRVIMVTVRTPVRLSVDLTKK